MKHTVAQLIIKSPYEVPFTFLPHESVDGPPPPPPPPKTKIEPVAEKKQYEISWPNIIRIEHFTGRF